MDSTLLQRITFNPAQCGGKPCIRGMRIRVSDVLQLLGSGLTNDKILEEFPDITKEDIQACLIYAANKTNHAVVKAA